MPRSANRLSSPCSCCARRTRPRHGRLLDAAAVFGAGSQGTRVREHHPLSLHFECPSASSTEIAAGVSPADISARRLEYARARDKSDKSLEIYKFFVNALYVAMTRAIRNLYLIESDLDHALFALLGLTADGASSKSRRSAHRSRTGRRRRASSSSMESRSRRTRSAAASSGNTPRPPGPCSMSRACERR